MQGIYERKVSVLPWLKRIETESVHKLKDKEKHFLRTEEGEEEMLLLCQPQHPGQPSLFSISISMQHLSILQ